MMIHKADHFQGMGDAFSCCLSMLYFVMILRVYSSNNRLVTGDLMIVVAPWQPNLQHEFRSETTPSLISVPWYIPTKFVPSDLKRNPGGIMSDSVYRLIEKAERRIHTASIFERSNGWKLQTAVFARQYFASVLRAETSKGSNFLIAGHALLVDGF